ncbi:MAG: glutathione S-transferase [Phenylobacterium sp.]|jgi:glutathione S-transferase|uniref:glutathione S-transferase family protein n=1 Tax=Phenylobacterium sp. TaxID=1871053 RepID=UPI001B4092F8|nr:glutathione S-transferase [Phenylobacterium sp.]MBP7649104.1 glutathione S-transferase [Phenylobacterium sp.]MBP7818032.1 glutathione S-transferase [Phenylobacterium sp.]MBP9230069.1 glutathione S-transferase [Phenylobacterium sp.]MBP9753633.1 glutathione S-transferase [Phenylobacterium sp.]
MKLFYSPASPYARKVLVVAQELGIALEVVQVGANPAGAPDPTLAAANPLAKIPALLRDDGSSLHDSRVICEYLDSLSSKPLTPPAGEARWSVLVEVSAADGLLDAALLARYEVALRPEPLRWPEWLAGQMGKIERALDFFETHPRDGENPSLADIAVACALGYLDFRFAHLDWRASRPKLAAFFAAISERPSLKSTAPA